MKKIIILAVLFCGSVYGIYRFLESPERYLKRTTKKVIKLGSVEGPKTEMAIISKAQKIAKYIHYDVHLKAEYEGRIYQERSLNEIRSLIMLYFKQNSTGAFEYEDMSLQILEPKKKAQALFTAIFYRNEKKVICEAVLDWLKEDKWFIKKIEIKNCKDEG